MTAQTTQTREIEWRDWGEEAFTEARRDGKLLLVDSGATWCHWCHVMDRVTYEDPEVVALVEDRFVPVRIDRDRRPEVDARLQQTPAVLNPEGAVGGWPLTVVMDDHGTPLIKATFLPPRSDPAYGAQSGLLDVLTRVDDYWRRNRERIRQAGLQLTEVVARLSRDRYVRPGKLTLRIVGDVLRGVKGAYDPQHGGFDGAPKFFCASAQRLLLARAWAGDTEAGEMLTRTLEAIARGGVYDHVGGGFHRYSVDARWHVPHFEKMAADNAALLALYADAFAWTGEQTFRLVTRETLDWIAREMTDPRQRGFYASQDADVGLDDDGDFFTWTEAEFRAALPEDVNADAIAAYFGVDAEGDVDARAGRNVLHTLRKPRDVARAFGLQADELAGQIRRSRAALLIARQDRPTPAVDQTIFADLNGMMIDAHLTAAGRLDDQAVRDRALAVLDHCLADLRAESGVFAHHRDGDGELCGVGRLADQAWMGRALLGAYTVTLRADYLEAADVLGRYIIEDLIDDEGALLSCPPGGEGPAAVAPRRAWEDSPQRSATSVAAQVLIDLGLLTGRDEYPAKAARALASFADNAGPEWGTFLGGYALAVEHHLRGPRTVLAVDGEAPARSAEPLAQAARRTYVPGGLVLRINPAEAHQAELLARLGYEAAPDPVAYVCGGKRCLEPARSPEEIAARIEQLRENG